MSLYLVRSRHHAQERSATFFSRKLDAGSRKTQYEELRSWRLADPGHKTVLEWAREAQGRAVQLLTTHEDSTPVTGIDILDMPEAEAERMQQAMPDMVIVRDQAFPLIPPIRATATSKTAVSASDLWHLRAIGLEAARQHGFTGTGTGVTIAVLDTGVDATHPELAGRVAGASTFEVATWQAYPMVPSQDTDGHGTHVSGLICGQHVGVAPSAQVLSGVMIPHGLGNVSDFILAMEWAALQPEVKIVNMSAGIPGYLPEMHEAVMGLRTVGVLPVFATGNEGRNQTRSPGNYIAALSVGATNSQNRVASFSSGGSLIVDNHAYTVPDLVAPGEAVYSSVVGGGYEAWDGTSMATPIVSGVAALILEKYPMMRLSDLMEELLATCTDLRLATERQGQGLVQVRGAL